MEKNSRCVLKGVGDGYPEALVGQAYFSWYCDGTKGSQEAYRIKVQSRKREVFWDTGWVESKVSCFVPYRGKPLEADEDYSVKVSVRTEEEDIHSESVAFSTGLKEEQWMGRWLKASQTRMTAPLFRKEFVAEKEVTRARLYLCGLGYQEAYVNGKKVGDDFLSPAWTDYRKRVSYVAYDIRELLHRGRNVVGIQLGAGWYETMMGCSGGNVLFSCQISLEYEDGKKEWIYSRENDGWLVYLDGPIKMNSIYIGEIYDARDEVEGWSLPDTVQNEKWEEAITTEPPRGRLVPQNVERIVCVAQRAPLSITEPRPGVYVVDFGQNLAGIIRIALEEPKDTEVSIRYAEILDREGMLNTANLRTAQARDLYISNGAGAVYQPRFTYHGFRYVEIKGLSQIPGADDIRALVIRSGVEKSGSFACSNPLINRIQDMCVWTESNNLHGVPTDCPQRDERLGWLNDLTVRAEEAVYNFDMHRFYKKFLQDIRDEQGEKSGAITDVVPYVRYGSCPADPVCSSYLILGWLLYQHYGDTEALEQYYEGFAAWTGFLENNTKDGIVTYSYYGDWAAPIGGNQKGSLGAGAVSSITPGELMSTGFLYYDAVLMSKMAEVLGRKSDITRWEKLAETVRTALNKTYYHPENGTYASGSQAANTFMSWLGISPEKQRTVAAIVKDVLEHQIHVTTGNICSRYILEVLSENGYTDLAYELATQTTYPSWGYMAEKGATTIWERWEYVESGPLLGMASHDHAMYASVSVWFYKYLLGIQVLEPGFLKFQLKPYVPGKLEWAQGTLRTRRGEIKAAWNQNGQRLTVSVNVPFYAKCKMVIPDGFKKQWMLDGKRISGEAAWLSGGEHSAEFSRIEEL